VCWSTKAAMSLKRVKIEEKLLGWPIEVTNVLSNGAISDPLRPPFPTLEVRNQPPPKSPIDIISGKSKAADFKFGQYIHTHRVHPSNSPVNILEKRERGRIQGLPKFFGYRALSQERVKLRTSNFVRTFVGSIGTKAIKLFGKSSRRRSQGLPKIFRAPIAQ